MGALLVLHQAPMVQIITATEALAANTFLTAATAAAAWSSCAILANTQSATPAVGSRCPQQQLARKR